MTISYIIKLWLLLPLVIYKKGGFIGALLVCFLTASAITAFEGFVNTYIYNDWEFLKYFSVAISIDLASGIVKNWINKTICWEDGLKKFSRKLFTCVTILVLFHVFVNFDDGSASAFAKDYLDMVKRLMILSFIGLSAITNIYEISGGKFPPLWLITRFKEYDDNGNKIYRTERTVSEEIKTYTKKVE